MVIDSHQSDLESPQERNENEETPTTVEERDEEAKPTNVATTSTTTVIADVLDDRPATPIDLVAELAALELAYTAIVDAPAETQRDDVESTADQPENDLAIEHDDDIVPVACPAAPNEPNETVEVAATHVDQLAQPNNDTDQIESVAHQPNENTELTAPHYNDSQDLSGAPLIDETCESVEMPPDNDDQAEEISPARIETPTNTSKHVESKKSRKNRIKAKKNGGFVFSLK